MVENPFAVPGAGRLYASHRPDMMAPVVEILRRVVLVPVRLAVDVGCGTGQSTRALTELAQRVVGIDAVPEMIAAAVPAPGVAYTRGNAESLPLDDGTCDLVTCGLSMHWFDRDRFLAEAHRVLAAEGILAAWNGGLDGAGTEGARWYSGSFSAEFPSPDRDRRELDDETMRAAGFAPLLREKFSMDVAFDVESFVGYLATNSNVLVRLRTDATALDPIIERLRTQVAPFFAGGRARWRMVGWVAAFRRSGGPPTSAR